MRAAIIYNASHRPDTTGNYCYKALNELIDVDHYQPGHPIDKDYDFHLVIDDGIPFDFKPCQARAATGSIGPAV